MKASGNHIPKFRSSEARTFVLAMEAFCKSLTHRLEEKWGDMHHKRVVSLHDKTTGPVPVFEMHCTAQDVLNNDEWDQLSDEERADKNPLSKGKRIEGLNSYSNHSLQSVYTNTTT